MSHFYGTLQGSRGQATRCGAKNSGLQTLAASWSGAIEVNIDHNEKTGEDYYRIYATPWHGQGDSFEIARGIVGKQP